MPETYPEPNAPSETTRFRVAFEATLPAIEAVPEAELLPITVDLPSTAATILGALPAIRALAPELAKLPYTASAPSSLPKRLVPAAWSPRSSEMRSVPGT